MKKGVFAIFKVSYNPITNQKVGGVCGTCFFINEKDFITAHHCFNGNLFNPNVGFPKVEIFLSHSNGQMIYNPEIKGLYPDYDLSIGTVNNRMSTYFSNFSSSDNLAGKGVYNLGYPSSRAVKDYDFTIVDGNLKAINIELRLEKQEGAIERMVNLTSDANDVKFKNRRVILLNHTSETGFSGGPLIISDREQVVGFMSLVLPKKTDLLRRVVAVPISEIQRFLG